MLDRTLDILVSNKSTGGFNNYLWPPRGVWRGRELGIDWISHMDSPRRAAGPGILIVVNWGTTFRV